MFDLFPYLTQYDPQSSAEGTIDPLGLAPIADSLGQRLAPGVRERQSRPRFLTAMAVGNVICSELQQNDVISKDGESEPWQVFEWHVVQGLALGVEDRKKLRGVPGIDKVSSAIKQKIPLSAKQYLVVPRVFGFHGVYRVLAQHLGVEQSGHLHELGSDLVHTWEKEQNLQGFYSSRGPGEKYRSRILGAIEEALSQGSIVKPKSWDGWQFIAEHLAPSNLGSREAEVICKGLLDERFPMRVQLFKFLGSPTGKKIWEETKSEKELHSALKKVADRELINLIETIQAYEQFAKLLTNAFQEVLICLSQRVGPQGPIILSKLESVKNASEKISALFPKVSDFLAAFDESRRFEEIFSLFHEPSSATEWVTTLIQHHEKVQKVKPPEGKNPWIESIRSTEYVVRTAYRRNPEDIETDDYVHGYRAGALASFVEDLRMVA